MKVLITGADGFIGSHLTELLLKEDYDVTALAQYNSFNDLGWLERVSRENNKRLNIISGDIRDPFFCNNLTKDAEIVFHLAALIAIPFSYLAPESYFETNVKGTLNICDSCLKNDAQRLIVTSTSEVYGSAEYVPIDENHPLNAQSPYSASKIAADAIATSFFNSFDLPVTIARPFNTYGPRQSARAIIPNIISQILSDKEVLKVGDISPTRDFTFVQDTCRAFLEIAKSKKTIGETINIGTNNEISINDLITSIKDVTGSNIQIKQEKKRKRPKNSEVFRLVCDSTKLKKLTGFNPDTKLKDGLIETVEWFSLPENLSKYKPEIYNV
tara:strand:+ start:951 stop:1934 length:984 start_codon:yes stop_codon:yes gene_type:complete